MPTGPKGQRRPADVIGNAIKVAQIAHGRGRNQASDRGLESPEIVLNTPPRSAKAPPKAPGGAFPLFCHDVSWTRPGRLGPYSPCRVSR